MTHIRFLKGIHWPEDLELPWAGIKADSTDYDELVSEEGLPLTASDKGAVILNQMFFVKKYMMEHRVVYDAGLGEFYQYAPVDGLWKKQTVESIKRTFSNDLTATAKTSGLQAIFQKRTDAQLQGLVALLQVHCERQRCFENRPQAIHVQNGMICFDDGAATLTTFHPDFLSRNQCPYSLEPDADCPRFKKELLGAALGADDILLLQKWAGAVLLGRNSAQRMLLLMGTPNGGKSTLMSILERVVGMHNIAQLRTQHLGDRFELFGCIGKTLLAGKDVAANFLMQKGAHVLKALVGGDLLEAEKKGFNERILIRGDFNVGITCNADLNIRLEGDEGAWRRRLLIIKYTRSAPARRIPDFAEKLLAEEGPGILQWMVDGAMLLKADLDKCGDYRLTAEQKGQIDNIMSQSESLQRFVETCVQREDGASIGRCKSLSVNSEYPAFEKRRPSGARS